uniref:Capsid protein n=1 Tax=Anelloviridae sp. TaxID=2055263 RepID=A0A2H4R0L2_9VIRU|nr:ORF1 [Anelloviridae sp.]
MAFYTRRFRRPRYPYYPRRRWYRTRRRRTYYPRRRNFRSRYYAAYRVRRRRVTWRKMFRKIARKRRNVKQFEPKTAVSCKIKAFAPLLWVLGADSAVQEFIPPNTANLPLWRGGGVISAHWDLANLYGEMEYFRATWSRSNQGLDLCRYWGTKITLFRSPVTNYIFEYSVDDWEDDPEPLVQCHPSQMLLHQKHIIVKQKSSVLQRPITIFIPPAPGFKGAWHYTKDVARWPLFKYRASLMTLQDVWTGFNQARGTQERTGWISFTAWGQRISGTQAQQHNLIYIPQMDDGHNVKIADHVIEWNREGTGPKTDAMNFWPVPAEYKELSLPLWQWAFGRNPAFYDSSKRGHRPAPADAKMGNFIFVNLAKAPAFRYQDDGTFAETHGDTATQTGWGFFITYDTIKQIATGGPFTVKSLNSPVNITIKLQSYWQWGGQTATKLPPMDPERIPRPKPTTQTLMAGIRDPTKVSDEVLHPSDLDSDGIIRLSALKRIIGSDAGGRGRRSSKRERRGSWPFEGDSEKKRKTESPVSKSYSTPTASSSERESSTETEETTTRRHRIARRKQLWDQLFNRLGHRLTSQGKTNPFGLRSHST